MTQNFRDRTTEDIFNGVDSKAARRIPTSVWHFAARKLDILNASHEIHDLRVPPGNRLEILKGALSGHHSIAQYRIIFRWTAGHATHLWISDYH
jgi:toxin HigB-1